MQVQQICLDVKHAPRTGRIRMISFTRIEPCNFHFLFVTSLSGFTFTLARATISTDLHGTGFYLQLRL